MISALVTLLIVILVVGVILWLCLWAIDSLPLPAPFGQIARIVLILIAILIILAKALPLLGVSTGL